ncbi:hypothetical protein [Mycobacterium asiaticum]|uniref:hypothetical protein n=1 Tax=Mycobacterium asiaticum TaxID=1790 RepID=UPI00114E6366|nr:hypothetical protein [Mycobacterium asiaticum]
MSKPGFTAFILDVSGGLNGQVPSSSVFAESNRLHGCTWLVSTWLATDWNDAAPMSDDGALFQHAATTKVPFGLQIRAYPGRVRTSRPDARLLSSRWVSVRRELDFGQCIGYRIRELPC